MREPSRTHQGIELLKERYGQTPYVLEQDPPDYKTDIKESLLLSIIIPARNEFPNIMHTLHSIWNCLEADGISYRDVEIIIVDNGSTDHEYQKPAQRGTSTHIMPRGAFFKRAVRVLYDPICGNHSARNKGARIARGKYLFFSDAHMSYAPGFFKYMIETIDKTGGLFHGTIAWMGGYPPFRSGLGYGYSIKLGEEIKGTWNNYLVGSGEDFFYIPAQGHCSVGVLRKQFLDFGGYPDIHRTYGGGEFFVDMLWWMYGSTVAVHPKAIGYHLNSGRGYIYQHDDYIENVLGVSYALGIDDWRERAYINWLRRGRKEVLDTMMERSSREHQARRDDIARRKVKAFNQILLERPWDILNIEKHRVKNSSALIFHPTWLELLQKAPEYVKEVYRNSSYQKDLEKFIVNNIWDNVYKKDKYDKNNLPKV